jgi:inhibitor of KinA
MTRVPLGERALILRDLPAAPYRIAAALNAAPPPGLVEAVASYDAVAVYIDPDRFDPRSLDPLPVLPDESPRRHRIPVCYPMGDDLAEAADRLGLTPAEVARAHSETIYRCAAVGFRPGFAYLGTLPDALAHLPRRAEPRLRVEAGSVGVTGRQTGVYPQAGPGGWWLIGRTPVTLVDPESGYYPVEAGDEVVFVPIDEEEFRAREGERL